VKRIDEVFAFVAVDPEDGTEGVIGACGPDGQWMPFVAADRARVESLRLMVQEIVKVHGGPIHLVHFSQRTVLETYTRDGAQCARPPSH
jgi:hypothetical protein